MNNGIRYEQHEMVMIQKYPTGAMEFYCPTCGRQFILQWPPAYKRIVLDPGDENAIHSSAALGISVDFSSVANRPERQIFDQTGRDGDPYLSLWAKYIEENLEI